MSVGASVSGIPALASLDDDRRSQLAALVEALADDAAPTSVHEPEEVWLVHIADSLSGIEPGGLSRVRRIADIGAGAGLPGLVLAAALPQTEVDLIESVARKSRFIEATARRCGLDNSRSICERSETWSAGDGRERYDAVTARAVGRLATLAELASPLLIDRGTLVCWKGRRDAGEEEELRRAAPKLAIEPVAVHAVGPYAGSRHRHIHVLRKNGPTPEGLPRRPGMAKKRPFGAEPRSRGTSSASNQ